MAATSDLVQRLRAWTYRRQSLGGAAADPLAALRDVVAVYSSHPTAPLALLARSGSFAPASLGELEQRREVVRLPGMRQSVFLLPTETAPRVLAATGQPLSKLAPRLRYAGLDEVAYAELKPRVLELLREPMTAEALQATLAGERAASGGSDGDASPEVRMMTAVRLMSYEGLVLRVGTSLRTDSLRYVATEAWLGQPLAEADQARSLVWLAEAYLRGYGPARVEDFAWWSGIPKRRTAEALRQTPTVDMGSGLLLPTDEAAAFASVEPLDPEVVAFLPKWDAYTMGYAPDGRQRLVDDAHLKRAYSSGGGGTLPGDGFPLVLHGGRAVATWSHRFAGNRMQVTLRPFELDAIPPTAVERALGEVGELLGATSVEIVTAAEATAPKSQALQ
jgi:hypothetical protein